MTNENGQLDSDLELEDDPANSAPDDEVSFVNPDGTFRDGWKEAFVPEDFRGRKVFDIVTDLKTAMKQLGNQDLLISRQGKGIMPPPENATQTEKDMFYEALGRPNNFADYKVEVPDELREYYDEPLLNEAKEALHAAGLTQKQVDAVMALDMKRLVTGREQLAAREKAELEAAEKTLRAEWGDGYEARLHLANRVVSENTTEEERPVVLEAIGNNPVVANFLANIGKKFMEGSLINADGSKTAMTPEECRNRAKELMSTPGYVEGTLPPATMERLRAEIAGLYSKTVTT